MVEADGGGKRFSGKKIPAHLLKAEPMLLKAVLMGHGGVKYAPRNWERGMKYSDILGPLFRHFLRWMLGQKVDPETGLPHLVHIAWGFDALICYEVWGYDRFDDVTSPHMAPWLDGIEASFSEFMVNKEFKKDD